MFVILLLSIFSGSSFRASEPGAPSAQSGSETGRSAALTRLIAERRTRRMDFFDMMLGGEREHIIALIGRKVAGDFFELRIDYFHP